MNSPPHSASSQVSEEDEQFNNTTQSTVMLTSRDPEDPFHSELVPMGSSQLLSPENSDQSDDEKPVFLPKLKASATPWRNVRPVSTYLSAERNSASRSEYRQPPPSFDLLGTRPETSASTNTEMDSVQKEVTNLRLQVKVLTEALRRDSSLHGDLLGKLAEIMKQSPAVEFVEKVDQILDLLLEKESSTEELLRLARDGDDIEVKLDAIVDAINSTEYEVEEIHREYHYFLQSLKDKLDSSGEVEEELEAKLIELEQFNLRIERELEAVRMDYEKKVKYCEELEYMLSKPQSNVEAHGETFKKLNAKSSIQELADIMNENMVNDVSSLRDTTQVTNDTQRDFSMVESTRSEVQARQLVDLQQQQRIPSNKTYSQGEHNEAVVLSINTDDQSLQGDEDQKPAEDARVSEQLDQKSKKEPEPSSTDSSHSGAKPSTIDQPVKNNEFQVTQPALRINAQTANISRRESAQMVTPIEPSFMDASLDDSPADESSFIEEPVDSLPGTFSLKMPLKGARHSRHSSVGTPALSREPSFKGHTRRTSLSSKDNSHTRNSSLREPISRESITRELFQRDNDTSSPSHTSFSPRRSFKDLGLSRTSSLRDSAHALTRSRAHSRASSTRIVSGAVTGPSTAAADSLAYKQEMIAMRAHFEERIASLEADNERAIEENDHLMVEIEHLESRLQASYDEYKQALENNVKSLNRVVQKHSTLAMENTKLAEEHSEMQGRYDSMLQHTETFKHTVSQLQKRNTELSNSAIAYTKFYDELLSHLETIFEIFNKILQKQSIDQAREKIKQLHVLTLPQIDLARRKLATLYSFTETAIDSIVEEHALLLIKQKTSPRHQLRIEELERKWIAERERRKLDAEAADTKISLLERENAELRERLKKLATGNK